MAFADALLLTGGGDPDYSKISAIDPKNMQTTLEKLFVLYFEKEETIDYIELSNSSLVIDGVKAVYDKLATIISSENSVNLWSLLGYFPNTSYLISYRLTGEFSASYKVSDNQIDEWLLLRNKKETPALLKLFGRSKINDAIAFDGSIISKKLSFHGYLFNNYLPEGKGILAVEQNKYFNKKYSALKCELLDKRYVDNGNNPNYYIRCIKAKYESARRWDGYFDFYNQIQFAYYGYGDEINNALLFLERLSNDTSVLNKIGYGFGYQLALFEKEVRPLRLRDYQFSYFDIIQQQIINIDFLSRLVVSTFSDYCTAIDCFEKIKQRLQITSTKCLVRVITTEEIKKTFIPELSVRYSAQQAAFTAEKIKFNAVTLTTENGCGNQMQDFLFRKTGKTFYVYDADFGLGKNKAVCYFKSGEVKYRSSAADNFKTVSSVANIGSNVHIFCDNFGDDIKGVISLVMKDVGVREDAINLFDGYMPNRKSTNTLSYSAYSSLVMQGKRQSLLTGKRKLTLEFAQVKGNNLFLNNDNNFLIKLLSARGSYDVYCPVCADIPIEAFIVETKKKPSRNLIVLENSNINTKTEFPYIVMLACERCKQKLSATLHNSSFNGRSVTLTFNIAHGQHEKITYKQTIELSPINIAIMKEAIK